MEYSTCMLYAYISTHPHTSAHTNTPPCYITAQYQLSTDTLFACAHGGGSTAFDVWSDSVSMTELDNQPDGWISSHRILLH